MRSLPRRPGPWIAIVLVAAALPYTGALRAAFTLDDIPLLFTNPMATPGMSALDWFGRPSMPGSVYRPVTMATFALNARFGAAPWSYHLLNVLLHVAASLAAFDLARLLLRSVPAAGLVALVFAVHPIHTEAVASVAGRAELLAALFALVCLSSFLRGTHPDGRVWSWLSVAAFAAAALSKESAIATALLLPLVALWTRTTPRRLAVRLAPHAAVVLVVLFLRHALIGAIGEAEPPPFIDNPLAHVGVFPRMATALVVLTDYLGTLALPIRLSADETYDQIPVVTSMLDARFVVALALLGGMAAWAWVARRRAPVLALAGGFFLAAFVVTSNLVIAIGTCKAERLAYLPSFGWCLAAGWGLRRLHAGRVGAAAVATGVLLLAARTAVRTEDWLDNYTLLTRTAVTSPDSARANANAAAMYGTAGQLDLAKEHYARALAIRPGFVPALVGLGGVAELRGDFDGALGRYLEALRLDSRARVAVLHAADLLARRGEDVRAREILRAAMREWPDDREIAAALARTENS